MAGMQQPQALTDKENTGDSSALSFLNCLCCVLKLQFGTFRAICLQKGYLIVSILLQQFEHTV